MSDGYFYGRGGGPEDDDEPRDPTHVEDHYNGDGLLDQEDEWLERQERILEHEDHFRGDR